MPTSLPVPIELSALARADLRAIFFHGVRTFGLEVANAYIDDIERRLTLLTDQPGLGEAVGGRSLPTRRFYATAHVIYYRARPDGIFVTRVLHARMDAKRHLE